MGNARASRVAALLILFFVTNVCLAQKSLVAPNIDVRVNDGATLQKLVKAPHVNSQVTTSAKEKMRGIERALQAVKKGGSAEARLSTLTGGPELMKAKKGRLTPKSSAPPAVIAKNFLKANRDLYGISSSEVDSLVVRGTSLSRSGLTMVRIEQSLNGLPVFGSDTRVLIDAEGGLQRVVGGLVPTPASIPAAVATLSAGGALVSTMASLGITVDSSSVTVAKSDAAGHEIELVSTNPTIGGTAYAKLVYFPLGPGIVVPAWRIVVFSDDADYMTVIDATNGLLLWRKNIRAFVSTQDARFSVYAKADGTPTSPAPPAGVALPGAGTQFPEVGRTLILMSSVMDAAASPNGWIDDGSTSTTGNNVDAYVDRVGGGGENNVADIGTLDNNGRPVGNPDGATLNRWFDGATPRDFSYSPAPVGGNPNAGDTPTGTGATQVNFRRGAVTNLFYISNWFHDQLFNLGFDEAAGNFQQTNFTAFGAGNDRVLAENQDSSGTNNANFSTPPDGTPGRMQMFRFTGPNPDRDASLDPEIVIHELAHGLSNRLVGNADGLVWSPGQSMGEGWSDFYALSLLYASPADDPDARYAAGSYSTYNLGGLTDNYVYAIRRFPYSTDNTVNPLTWADVDDSTASMSGGIAPNPLGFEDNGALEVHNAGEVWALSLWEVRSRVIADPAGANGDIPTGNATMLQVVTDALKMTPSNPSFIDGRDAILDADCATNACANEQSIWDGFADRGLGYGAVAPLGQVGFSNFGSLGIGESFIVPHLDYDGSSVNDTNGNANGTIDPGEPILLSVTLSNPWRNAAKNVASATATLTSSSPLVTILTGSSSWGAIAAQSTTASATPFVFLVSPLATAGAPLDFTLTTTSDLGTKAVNFKLRVGAVSGTGAPITYTKTEAPGLAIPDGDPTGVVSSLTVIDDVEIADVDFRVDNLTHTFTGDLILDLHAPNGYGTSLIWLREALFGGGDGDNFVNTRIDDESTNDLNQSASTDAPYTGSWQPAFNSPVWLLFGDPALFPDPVGQLALLDGLSTAGVWKTHVADAFNLDAGALNSWSLIVTPVAYTITPFAAAVEPAATQSVTAGPYAPGGTVTYTATITNNGSAIQADNAGNEFIEVLPPQLTLVSANATSGTAVATIGTNTVTWNGALNPLGGSVTITIVASINANAGGAVVSAQGTFTYDADANGTNEATVLTDDVLVGGAADPNVFTVLSPAQLAATLTIAGSQLPGGTVTYTATITNSAVNAQFDNAGDEFTLTLPAGLTLTSASATSGTAVASIGPGTVTWNGSLAGGASVTITIGATINAGTEGQTLAAQGTISYDADGNLTNEASALSDDPGVAGSADPTNLVVLAPTLLSATKQASGSLIAGTAVSYTIVLTNGGDVLQGDNPGNELTDVLPAGLTLVSASATSGTAVATVATNTVTWNGSLAASTSVTITINATINAAAGDTISNQASVSFDADDDGVNEASGVSDDPSAPGATDATSFVVISGPSLGATKTVSGSFVPNGSIQYTIVVTNNGGTAQQDNAGAELTDTLPAGLTLVSASSTSGTAVATIATNTVTWNGSLAPAATVTMTIDATITATAGTTVSNQASISFDADDSGTNETGSLSDDPSAPGAADVTSFVVIDGPSLTATKSASGIFSSNSTVQYTILLANNGSTAQLDNAGAELTDVLPSGLTLVSASATIGSAVATIATNTVTWNGLLAANTSVAITVNATINASPGATIDNQATISFDSDANGTNDASAVSDDPSVAGANDPTSFVVIAAVDLSATKTVSGNFATNGPIEYSIVITNNGGTIQNDNPGAELTDVLPPGLTLVSASATSGTALATTATNTVTWNGSLAPGISTTITIQALVTASAGATISNQATLSFDANADGTNEATAVSDDPALPGPSDATAFAVTAEIPFLSPAGLASLALFMAFAAFVAMRRLS